MGKESQQGDRRGYVRKVGTCGVCNKVRGITLQQMLWFQKMWDVG